MPRLWEAVDCVGTAWFGTIPVLEGVGGLWLKSTLWLLCGSAVKRSVDTLELGSSPLRWSISVELK